MNTLISLDLSSTCTGWALFNFDSVKLLDSGVIKGSVAGLSKMNALHAKLVRIEKMAAAIRQVVAKYDPQIIVIEEIAGSKNRLSQKTLDFLHHMVLHFLCEWVVEDKIYFQDVGGSEGWRTFLDIRLSNEDKKLNQKARREGRKKDVIGWKDLSCRFVEKELGLKLNPKRQKTDGDEADAICVGWSFLKKTKYLR